MLSAWGRGAGRAVAVRFARRCCCGARRSSVYSQVLRCLIMNLADIEGDRLVGKHTLASVLGPRSLTRLYAAGQGVLYAGVVVLAAAGSCRSWWRWLSWPVLRPDSTYCTRCAPGRWRSGAARQRHVLGVHAAAADHLRRWSRPGNLSLRGSPAPAPSFAIAAARQVMFVWWLTRYRTGCPPWAGSGRAARRAGSGRRAGRAGMTTAAGATPSDIRVAQQLCEHARRRTQPALREAVSRLPGPLAPAGAYQFGWQYTALRTGQARPRPEQGRAVGRRYGPPWRISPPRHWAYRPSVPSGSRRDRTGAQLHAGPRRHHGRGRHRRGRPTLWKRFGVGPALLAGDSLHVLAMEALLRRRDDRSAAGAALLNRALLATMYGQVRDLSFVQRPWAGPGAVSVAEYRAAAKGKTGALLACAAALGALLAGGRPRQVARFAAFGRHMGVAFQCADDILGLWGDQRRTGKPVGNDLLLARKTIPVLLALTGDTPAAARLRELLTRKDTPLTRQVLPEALGLIGEAGGEEATRREAEHQRELALRMLAAVPMPADVRGRFAAMAAYLTRRGS